ncbi:MAG TPA: hypothetical protein VGD10_03925 [Allosphingosinicella sp.]|uniref:hypothetical protein n=1 Tax=Allosphingosinicella sp. TaxID=2823234 RepID=UPI002EDB6957
MTPKEVRIEGFVAIDPPVSLDSAHVEVQLRASGMADAASVIVARAVASCSGEAVSRIEFALNAMAKPDEEYTLAAEVRRGAALAPGDLLSVASHPWRHTDDNPVMIEVKPIR